MLIPSPNPSTATLAQHIMRGKVGGILGGDFIRERERRKKRGKIAGKERKR